MFLPTDVIKIIILYCDANSFGRLSQTCKLMYNLCKTQTMYHMDKHVRITNNHVLPNGNFHSTTYFVHNHVIQQTIFINGHGICITINTKNKTLARHNYFNTNYHGMYEFLEHGRVVVIKRFDHGKLIYRIYPQRDALLNDIKNNEIRLMVVVALLIITIIITIIILSIFQ